MIFKRFFKPYAEYCLRTTLSEDELKNALGKELPGFLQEIHPGFPRTFDGLDGHYRSCERQVRT